MNKIDNYITKAVVLVGGVSLIVMMLAIVVNVVGRALWDSPFYGMVEIVGLSGVFLISAAVGYAEKRRVHIVITIIIDRLSGRWQTILVVASLIASILVMVMLVYSGMLIAYEDWTTPGATTYVLHLNKGPFRFVWVVGAIALCYFLIQHLYKVITKTEEK